MGINMNQHIKSHKNFKNPALYEFLVQKYSIDEKGTNFISKIFNPHRFKKEDFYNCLGNFFFVSYNVKMFYIKIT